MFKIKLLHADPCEICITENSFGCRHYDGKAQQTLEL